MHFVRGIICPGTTMYTYPILESGSTVLLLLLLLQLRGPQWILKWVGLESSGQRLISLNGKTKRIAFFAMRKKNIYMYTYYFVIV